MQPKAQRKLRNEIQSLIDNLVDGMEERFNDAFLSISVSFVCMIVLTFIAVFVLEGRTLNGVLVASALGSIGSAWLGVHPFIKGAKALKRLGEMKEESIPNLFLMQQELTKIQRTVRKLLK